MKEFREEEKKAVFEKFRDEIKELSPEELEGIAGGWNWDFEDKDVSQVFSQIKRYGTTVAT